MKYQLDPEEFRKIKDLLEKVSRFQCEIVSEHSGSWDHYPETEKVVAALQGKAIWVAGQLDDLRSDADELLRWLC